MSRCSFQTWHNSKLFWKFQISAGWKIHQPRKLTISSSLIFHDLPENCEKNSLKIVEKAPEADVVLPECAGVPGTPPNHKS